MTDAFKGRVTLALTGASGAQYGLRLLQCLLQADYQVLMMVSKAAQVVVATETDINLPGTPDAQQAFCQHTIKHNRASCECLVVSSGWRL